jgi:arylsulfatase A-like enzyme
MGRLFEQANNGLRGYKRGMYEGALRQAALAWWPGTVPAGRIDDQPWAFWDVMPTFVELAGVTPPTGYETDGKSLVEYLKGGNAPQRDYFYWELHEKKPIQAARFGDWKAIRNGIDSSVELYNLASDPAEADNVADTHPEQVNRAKQIFIEAHRPDPNWPLDKRADPRVEKSARAWAITRDRVKNHYVPPNADKRLAN